MKQIALLTLFVAMTNVGQAFEVVSGCEEADYVEAEEAMPAVGPVQGAALYTPKCLKVVVDTEVAMTASRRHPLAPIAIESESEEDAKINPIPESSADEVVKFEAEGIYGYFCTNHGKATGKGMAGAIWVVAASKE